MTQEQLDQLVRRAQQAPCISALHLRVLEADTGWVRIAARRDPNFAGLQPGFHGGMQAAVADCVAWFAIATQTGPDEPMVTSDLDLRYLRPCLGDLVCEGRVIKLGRTLCPTQVDGFDPEGQRVMTGIITYVRVNAIRPT